MLRNLRRGARNTTGAAAPARCFIGVVALVAFFFAPARYADAGAPRVVLIPENVPRELRTLLVQGDPKAQSELGDMYYFGLKDFPEDDAEAAKWYRLAAEQGHAGAQYLLGEMYYDGHGVEQDYTTALKWYRRSAEQNQAGAPFGLGRMYYFGKGVPQDHAEAAKWFRHAAQQDDHRAQFALGLMYEEGEGVPQDYLEAVKWYRRSAEQGYADAQANLGSMFYFGKGVVKDYAAAIRWYRRGAERNQAHALFGLGRMYYFGDGVPQDHAEAAKWYQRAAEQGHLLSQNNLGLMYKIGRGVPQDYEEAVKWYRRAAEKGHADAQASLGDMYYTGKGLPQDYEEAMRWSRLAVAQNGPLGMVTLGEMHEYGKGTTKDLVLAHMWYNLASANQYFHDVAADNRNRVAARMTSAEVARAQRLARDWKPGSDPGVDSPETSLTGAGTVLAVQRLWQGSTTILAPKMAYWVPRLVPPFALSRRRWVSLRMEECHRNCIWRSCPRSLRQSKGEEQAVARRYWRISGYESGNKMFETHVPVGCLSERQMKDLLRALAAKVGLTLDEIVGAYARKNTRYSNDLLVVQKEQLHPGYMCGDNLYFVAGVVERK